MNLLKEPPTALHMVGNKGKVYRTGGDEFMVISYMENPELLHDAIKSKTRDWKGNYTKELNLAVGYASLSENPAASIDDLEHLADTRMYEDKSEFYSKSGNDRRRG